MSRPTLLRLLASLPTIAPSNRRRFRPGDCSTGGDYPETPVRAIRPARRRGLGWR